MNEKISGEAVHGSPEQLLSVLSCNFFGKPFSMRLHMILGEGDRPMPKNSAIIRNTFPKASIYN